MPWAARVCVRAQRSPRRPEHGAPRESARRLQVALKALLVSPDFLFRVERDPPAAAPGEVYRIDDVELASRLPFFLWSSLPDETLLAAAEHGNLHETAELERQVQRTIADPRADAFVEHFAGQWL